MAPFTQKDPWLWSANDVAEFFRSYAPRTVAQLPGLKLPPSQQFTDTLVEQEVTGATLLLIVDDDFLIKHCNVTTAGTRAAVVYCIDKLKAGSDGFKSRNDPIIWEAPEDDEPMQLGQEQPVSGPDRSTEAANPAQTSELSASRDRPLQPLAARGSQTAQELQASSVTGESMQIDTVSSVTAPQSTQGVGGNPRPVETLVEGQDGRKRRRLNLALVSEQAIFAKDATVTENRTTAFDAPDRDFYLPTEKLPIDRVFFGDTAVGSECGPLQIKDPRYIKVGPDPEDYEFIGVQGHSGVANYIDSQWRRFMHTRDETSQHPHDEGSTVRFPYRVNLQADKTMEPAQYGRRGRILFSGVRSAVVIQQNQPSHDQVDSSVVAVREDEALLESGARELGFSKEQIAELDGPYRHLLLKYQPTEEKDNEGSDNGSSEAMDEDMTESGDDMAEVDHGDGQVTPSEVKRIIQNSIDTYITRWKEHKLSGLESKSARTIWRKTRRSKFVRDQLIQGAQKTIKKLDERLGIFVKDMEHGEWDSAWALEKQCESLQVTVEDIQFETWKIEVWQRKKEPEHTSTRNASHKHNASKSVQHVPNECQAALRGLGSEDRLQTLPQVRSSPPPAELADSATRDSEFEGEHFHTPQGSPVDRAGLDSFVVPDDTGEDSTEHAMAGSSMPADAPEATAQDWPDNGQKNGVPSTPSGKSKLVPIKTPTSSAPHHEPKLPSPWTLHAGSEKSPIVLDSSPVGSNTPIVNETKKRSKPIGTPARAKTQRTPRTSEADLWSYEELAGEEDRERILQKHLRDLGHDKREELHRAYQQAGAKKFKGALIDALAAISDSEDVSPRVNNPKGQQMKLCARLLLSWYFTKPELVQADVIPQDILRSMPSESDCKTFVDRLRTYLGQRMSDLYMAHKPTSLDDPMLIETDDEPTTPDNADMDGPEHTQFGSVKKRRRVALDLDAASTRKVAKARLERTQRHQSSNPAMLQGMASFGSSQGECEINLPREPEQEPIYLRGKIAQEMKPYQLEGVQFLWRELTADLENGKGSLLAHTMGLGKTMQSIALLTCVDNTSKSTSENIRDQLPKALQLKEPRQGVSLRFLVICPPTLIQNWYRELQDWAPQHSIYRVESSPKPGWDNVQTLKQWSKRGGVSLIGYNLFRSYVQKNVEDVAENKREDVESIRDILLDDTDLVIADEAHHIKNTDSSTSKAVCSIKTTARVALSGTPMSNDVDEIYALVSWVDPGYLGDKKQFNSFYGLPIKDGLYADSSPQEKRHSTIKLKNLHDEIAPKVNRADISVLKGSLRPKVEFVLTVELTELQREVYAMTVAALIGTGDNLGETALTRIFSWLAVLGLLTAHPLVYRRKLLTPPQRPKKGKSIVAKAVHGANVNSTAQANDDDVSVAESEHTEGTPEVPGDENPFALGFTEAIVSKLLEDVSDDLDPTLSAKTRLLQQILQLSKRCGDKVLVFSSHIPTLDYLRELFDRDGISFRRIDGSVPMMKRNEALADFQTGKVDVMLISTRAGGQGLNIQQANRVVIFDFGFNPAWEEQAIGRAYRLGQPKPVFVYRFVAGGTFESNIYNTQMFKTTLMKRVIDKKNTKRQAKRNTKDYLYPPKTVACEDVSNELELDLDPQVMSKILKAQVDRGSTSDPSIDICAVRTMEVLQAEAADEPLNDEELRTVEENKARWKAMNSVGGFMNVNDPALARAMGVPSSTAPNILPPHVLARASSGPSTTQVAPHRMLSATQADSHTHGTSTNFPARDIRNQAASANARAPPNSLAGLPFDRTYDPL